jgi:UDP-3-O-[3-hydroxymyristoyl] glucosamine N-acyltransferase
MTTHFIDPSAEIHPSVKVWHFAVILAGVSIGEKFESIVDL